MCTQHTYVCLCYTAMSPHQLLHLCADSSIQKGVHKALSLLTGSPVDEDVLMGRPQTATPLVTCNDCVRLHRLVYQPLQDGEDVSCHEVRLVNILCGFLMCIQLVLCTGDMCTECAYIVLVTCVQNVRTLYW